MTKKTYMCVGCGRVHYDSDYSGEDGDLEILRWCRFMESVNEVNKEITMKFKLKDEFKESVLREKIKSCQKEGHIQQVAFSTYHNCITQICFTCQEVRTSMKEDDYLIFNKEQQGELNG